MGRSGPGPKPRVDDERIVAIFADALEAGELVLGTGEVAEQLPIERRWTLDRLKGLADAGVLGSKKVGARNRVWWLAEAAESISPRED